MWTDFGHLPTSQPAFIWFSWCVICLGPFKILLHPFTNVSCPGDFVKDFAVDWVKFQYKRFLWICER